MADLTIKQIAARHQIAQSTLYYWAANGMLPGARQLNGIWRVNAKEFDAWYNRQEVKTCQSISVAKHTGFDFKPMGKQSVNQLRQRLKEKRRNLNSGSETNIIALPGARLPG